MDPEPETDGKPHGGVRFTCRHRKNLVLTSLKVNRDKIDDLYVKYNDNNIMTIHVVYLPYYEGKIDQMPLCSDTI